MPLTRFKNSWFKNGLKNIVENNNYYFSPITLPEYLIFIQFFEDHLKKELYKDKTFQ